MRILSSLSLILVAFITTGQQGSRITITTPSIEQEASSIWRNINDISFLEKQGYNINLPRNSVIDSLITKSKQGTFGNEDFSTIYNLLENGIFDSKSYTQAIKKIEPQLEMLNGFVIEIDESKDDWDWDFKSFDQYRIHLTLYGTGGSYDPDEGIITILTNQEGAFMSYENPANTIIHEITHMGMEYSLVRKYNLSHGLKERLVDTFVFHMFKDHLPEYRIQNMGDTSLDKFISSQEDISSLNEIISTFVEQN